MRGFTRCFGLIRTTGCGLCLLLALWLCPTVASAEDYYWSAQSGTAPGYGQKIPSAKAACEIFHAAFANNPLINDKTPRDVRVNEWLQQCGFLYYSTRSSYARSGDGCTSPNVYDSTTGGCEPPEPDKCEATAGSKTIHEHKRGVLGGTYTEPPTSICESDCQYSFTFNVVDNYKFVNPEADQIGNIYGAYEYQANGVTCTTSTDPNTGESVFDQPPSLPPIDKTPVYNKDNVCGEWTTTGDGKATRTCTGTEKFVEPGKLNCSENIGLVDCTAGSPSPEFTETKTTEKTDKTTNPDGSTKTTNTKTTDKTTCKGVKPCTSTSKTETTETGTDSEGKPTDEKTECTGDHCKPGDEEGEEEEEEGDESMVSGDQSCGATPSCEGDAIQCAILRQTHKSRCDQEEFQDLSPEKIADAKSSLESEFAGADYQPLTAGVEGTFNLEGMLDTSSSIGGSCPSLPDITFTINGQTKTFSFMTWLAELCKYAVWFSYLLVAFAMRGAAEIVAGGLT